MRDIKMNNPITHVKEVPRASGFLVILRAWRLLLIAFLVGGLLGAAVYAMFPPPYRAEAVMVMDQNLEKSFPTSPDRELFYFLERETTKLEELAWSDEVLSRVALDMKDVSVEQLRNGKLQLSQPSDGGWRFYGIDPDPKRAAALANSWADSYMTEIRQGVRVAQALDDTEAQLNTLTTACPTGNSDQIKSVEQKLADIREESYGIHSLSEVYRSQEKHLKVDRVSSQALYIFAGAMSGLVLMIIAGAIIFKGDSDEPTIS
jgi:capsular polysaccharide biosynthesis protein